MLMPLQALKPKWPATDCYHACCDGAAPAKTLAPAKEAAETEKRVQAQEAIAQAKESKKEAVKELEKAADILVRTSSYSGFLEQNNGCSLCPWPQGQFGSWKQHMLSIS
jgi:hypothetical protein